MSDVVTPDSRTRLRPGRSGRQALAVLLVVLLAVVAVGYVVIRSARATDGVRPGELWEKSSSLGLDYAHTLTFDLPSGQLVVQVATPVDAVSSSDAPAGLVDPGAQVHSGSEAAFVPIAWNLQGEALSVPDTPLYQFQVVLVDGDHRYDLHAGSSSEAPADALAPMVTSKAMTVVVAGDGTGLVVEVGYDGLTQKGYVGSDDIDPGVAAPYYSDQQRTFTPAQPCSLFTRQQLAAFQTIAYLCRIGTVQTMPYVPGLGWVDPGDHAWAVVDVRVSAANGIERRRNSYAVTHQPYRVRLDRHGPVEVLMLYDDGSTHQATYVFRTDSVPATVQLVASFTGTRGAHVVRFGTDRTIALR